MKQKGVHIKSSNLEEQPSFIIKQAAHLSIIESYI